MQFFGAFNSNLVKNALVIFVTYQGAHFAAGSPWLAGMESGVIVNLAAGLFILPVHTVLGHRRADRRQVREVAR